MKTDGELCDAIGSLQLTLFFFLFNDHQMLVNRSICFSSFICRGKGTKIIEIFS